MTLKSDKIRVVGNKVSNSLAALNKNLTEKSEELENLLSIRVTKNLRKRTTSFKRNW